MKSFFFTLALTVGIVFAPASTFAQTPQPVVEAMEIFESGTPYRANVTTAMKMTIFGTTLKTNMKLSSLTEAAGNAEGKMTMKMVGGEGTDDEAEFTLGMQYKYFENDNAFYLKITKLPKDMPQSVDDAKKGVWYRATIDDLETLAQATGSTQITGMHFVEAQSKYPTVTFTEKGSTKKDYQYAYSINKAMLQNFLMEQARLAGTDLTLEQAQASAGMLGGMKGTLAIDKKTMRPTKQTQQIGSSKDAMSVQTTATYKFGGTSKIKRPAKAVSDDELVQGLFPSL